MPHPLSACRPLCRKHGDDLLRGDVARGGAGQAAGAGDFGADQAVADREQDEAQGRLVERAFVAGRADVANDVGDGVGDRFQRFVLAGQHDPGHQFAHALLVEGVEHALDDVAQPGLAAPHPADRLGDRGRHLVRDLVGERAVKPGDAAEMVEQIGVGAADPRGDRFQGDRCDAVLAQQFARRVDRQRAAFLRRQALADWCCY